MIRDGINKFIIDNDNRHLQDLYYLNSAYLELGSIDYDVMRRLLNFELIAYEDITYFPIQNKGIGRSEVNNENLRKILPFLFFERLNQKNKNNQLFISYGLLHQKDENNQEIFSPIALIPINIYFENDRIFIQQISRPIENSILINYLNKTKKIEISANEKLDSVYALDKYCLSFAKYEEFSLKLENYLTFASLKEPEMKLDRNFFDGESLYPDYLSDCLYDKDEPYLYYSLPLTRKQRQAVYKGAIGDNLVLSGRLGTGKTTTLFNIAMNAIGTGKRVLYVSNMKETLGQVNRLFEEKGMQQHLTDFSNSFASFHQGELLFPSEISNTEPEAESLDQSYRFVKKYVDAMIGRMLDFRFIDLVNQLATIADHPKQKLDIDDLSGIYKSEYLEIHSALESIEENLKKIKSFKNSLWKEIPIINNIKYPNQIFSLIHQVQKNYLIFEEKKEILEKQFGLKPISNYAYLKSVFHDIKGLDIKAFPLSWVNREIFEQAQEEFRNLKSHIYQIQEMEYLLLSQYENLDSIDIDSEYSRLLGNYFFENNVEKIDRLLEEKVEVSVLINKLLVQINIYRKTSGKIISLLNWEFPESNLVLNEIQNMNRILQSMKFSPEFIRSVTNQNLDDVSRRIKVLIEEIKTAEAEIDSLFKNEDFGKSKDLEQNIVNLERFTNNQTIKRSAYRLFSNIEKESPNEFSKLRENVKRFRVLKNIISDKHQEYKKLTGFDFEEGILENLHKFYSYFHNIPDKLIKSKFIKFIKTVVNIQPDDPKVKKNFRNIFDLFSKAYFHINAYYLELTEYGFSVEEIEFSEKIKEIEAIINYLQNLYLSNDRVKQVKKAQEKDYVQAEEYIWLYKTHQGIVEKKKELRDNDHYRYLYGKLYANYDTNINNISRFLQAFKVYSDCFSNDEKLIDSLNEEINQKLILHLDNCEEASDSLTEVFKLYFKVFKDSVSKYYYSSFESILESLDQLINSKDELIGYLGVTDNLKILNQYNLPKLVEFITDLENPENLSINFKYTYLETVMKIYLEKHPFLADYKVMKTCLEAAMNMERDLIRSLEMQTFRQIRRNSSYKFSVFGIRNLDYSAYIRRTDGIKHLFLTSTQILNNFLNPTDFDLIIIDDAHLLSANDYYRALQGKQVVVAGELQLLSSVANNLISRVSNRKSIILDFRFLPTPNNLLVQMQGLRGVSYPDYYNNFGIEIISEKILEYINLLFKENRNYVINLFTSNLNRQKQIYETLTDLFTIQGFSEKEILSILKRNINITDLNDGYLFDADYNIIYLEDYYDLDFEYLVVNLIDVLMLCKKRLIIYDDKDILQGNVESRFLTEIRRVISKKEIYLPKNAVGPMKNLVSRLEKAGIKVYASAVFSLLLLKDDKFYGVLLFWDEENTDYEILNEYRENYLINRDIIKTFIIWSLELMESVEKVANRILDGMRND